MVALNIRDGSNVSRTITELRIRDGTNTQRTITELWIRDVNNVPRLVYNPSGSASLAVSATPTSVYDVSSGTGTATTPSVSAVASGGTGPYTYAWTLVSYDNAVPPTANSPSSATTTFTQTSIGVGEAYTSTWRVTATDALSNTATDTVIANFADAT